MQSGEAPLDQRVKRWLETQGYPLEMQVARLCHEQHARVIQSEYYKDPVTSQQREVDVVAWWQGEIDRVHIRVTVIAECKTSKEKPWVLFCSPGGRLSQVAQVAQRAGSRLCRLALLEVAKKPEIYNLPVFSLPDSPGYSLTQAFTSGQDVCYGAVAGAAAAAAAQSALPDRYDSRVGHYEVVELILPVVVTDARLFAASLNDSATIEMNEIEGGVLLWRNRIVGVPHTIVHVLTPAALPSFLKNAKDALDALQHAFSKLYPGALARALEARAHERVTQL